MKKILTHLFITFLFCFHVICLYAQTMVNQTADTTGSPTLNFPFQAACKTSDNGVVVVGNTYSTTSGSNLLVTKYSSTGAMLWQFQYGVSADSGGVYGVDVFALGSYVYVAGAITGPFNVDAILKITSDSGQIVWVQGFGAVNYVVPSKIVADSSGNVYVASTAEITTGESAMVITKFNSSGTQLWVHAYDTTGMYSGATAIALPTDGDTDVTVTGFSGSGFSSWNFLTAYFGISTGTLISTKLTTNGDGNFSSPAGVGKDYQDRVYIAGTAAYSGSNTDIKTIAFDSVYNQRWVADYGNADSLVDSASRMTMDPDANILITGYTTASNGVKNLLTLKYSNGGSLLWSRTIGAPKTVYNSIGTDITSDDSLNVYVSGYFYNGATNNNDFITIVFDKNGNILWEKSYDGGGTNDVANDIVLDNNNNIFVSGISSSGATATYLTLEYTQLKDSIKVVRDLTGKAIYAKNRVIVRFNENAINQDVLLNRDFIFAAPSVFLTGTAYSALEKIAPFDLTKTTMIRLTALSPADTISISRLGTPVKVPPLWAAFALDYDTSSAGDEVATANALHAGFPSTVIYAHPDYIGHLDGTANDPAYPNQASLHPTSDYDSASINIEPAWNFGFGQPYIKVGVIDDGADYTNADLGHITGGKDYTDNGASIFISPNGTGGHGTMVMGVLGATANNDTDIAGIAGGGTPGSPGASLYAFRTEQLDTVLLVSTVYGAITENATYIAGNPNNSFYGLNIMNCSFGFDSSFTIYSDSNILLLQDAVHFANRNAVTFVASRGNTGDDRIEYPACYFDPWVESVGASGEDGHFAYSGNTRCGTFFDGGFNSSWGRNTDILAPSSECLVQTVATATVGPVPFSGTSASAPAMSGVAALLMSNYNADSADIRNLTPEDIDYMAETTATPVTSYDTAKSGRLNAGEALNNFWRPKYSIQHIISIGANSSSFDSDSSLFIMPFPSQNKYGQYIDKGAYYANEVKVFKSFMISALPTNEVIEDMWPDWSLSDITDETYYNNQVTPFEFYTCCTTISGGDSIQVNASATIWLLYDTVSHQSYWYPYSQTYANDSSQWAISVLYNNINVLSTQQINIKNYGASAVVYPNPTRNTNTLVLTTTQADNIQIDLYDMAGNLVSHVYNGYVNAGNTRFYPSVEGLENGLYLYRIGGSNFSFSEKFIKLD